MGEVVVRIPLDLKAFEREAHGILAKYGSSSARVVTLKELRASLSGLSLGQGDLFNQAIKCAEFGLYRSSHVMAWVAFVDCLQEKLVSDNLVAVHASRPKWAKWKTIEDLRENVSDHQLIEVAKEVRIITKNDMRSLQGQLARRNDCAHPSSYEPSLNTSIGYIDELLRQAEKVHQKLLEHV